MIRKLKYGLARLRDELTNTEDYWHLPFIAREIEQSKNLDRYFLDVRKKAEYPFAFKNGIPMVNVNDKAVELPVTILNFGLGVLDQEVVKEASVLAVFQWLKNNQQEDGSWLQQFEDSTYELKSGWVSGMTQGLAISFLARAAHKKLINYDEAFAMLEKAKFAMLSELCVQNTTCGPIIEEYPGTSSYVLNGFIFSLYGLYDYGLLTGDYADFEKFEQSLACVTPDFDFRGWTYYDKKGLIASRLYHNLHLEMMKSMFLLTEKPVYNKFYKRWKKYERLYFIFVLFKAKQKLMGLSKIDTLDK